jgi:DNA-binding transcriptional LysR family regulator
MQSLRGIVSFLQTAETGSFTRAGRVLGISGVAVGKNVSVLETALGVRLLQRSTRQLKLTDEGQLFVEQCQNPLRDLEFAYRTAHQRAQSPTGTVRITSVVPFGRGFVQPLLAQFALLYPKLRVELVLNDQVTDMIADGFDIGIRVGHIQAPNMIARNIAPLPFVIVAAPSYLQQNPVPQQLSDLAQHNCLCFRTDSIAKPEGTTWQLGNASARTPVAVRGNLMSNDLATLLAAALAGQGLIFAPLPLVRQHLRRGELQIVLPQFMSRTLVVYLHYPSRKNLPARVKVAIDFLIEKLHVLPDLQAVSDADYQAWTAK